MRLINTWTGQFENFVDLENTPPYAILSHTWEREGEQSYQDVVKIQEKYIQLLREEQALQQSRSDVPGAYPQRLTPSELEACTTPESHPTLGSAYPGSPHSEPEPPDNDGQNHPTPPPILSPIWDDPGLSEKIRKACEIARRDGYRYIWIDSCCIDKTVKPEPDSELSEAINSMFDWYRGAQICYAFLADVPSNEDVRSGSSKFRDSRWFRRGWTLQELVAPLVVVFLSRDWKGLGTKEGLGDIIENITSIDCGVLSHRNAMGDESVADRMRWASNRETTRVEDMAYSLMGIFGITMPTSYGERIRAFRRLQEEILQQIPDQSLFVWGDRGAEPVQLFPRKPYQMEVELTDSQTLFAHSPDDFGSTRGRVIQPTKDAIKFLPMEEYTRTPYGIRTKLYLLPLKKLNPYFHISISIGGRTDTVEWYLVVLRSQYADHPQKLLSRLCYIRSSDRKADIEFLYLADSLSTLDPGNHVACDIFSLSPGDLADFRDFGEIRTVYLPHLKPHIAARRQLPTEPGEHTAALSLQIPAWVEAALQLGGSTTDLNYAHSPAKDPSFTLIHAAFNIHIHYRHMVTPTSRNGGAVIMIEARVWILPPDEGAPIVVQFGPPDASATWVARHPWVMTLPTRSLNLIAGYGDGMPVTLWLGLDLTELFQYNLRIEIASNINKAVAACSLRPRSETMQRYGPNFGDPHETLNLILLGSARRALEMKGYSTHFAFHPSLTHLGDSHSHTLTLSTRTGPEKFDIVVKYLHTLDDAYHTSTGEIGGAYDGYHQAFEIVARVTLETFSSSGGLERFQDGPYVVAWKDQLPGDSWKWSLGERDVVLTTPAGNSLTLRLGLDLAWYSEYYLNVDINPGLPQSPPLELWDDRHRESPSTLDCWAQMNVTLTLPEHYKRGLQAQGYHARLEQLDVPGGESEPGNSESVHRVLTLSHNQAGVDIVIEYSHHVTTSYPKTQDSDFSTRRFRTAYPFLLPENSAHQPDSVLPALAKASLQRCYQEMTVRATVRTRCRTDPGGTGIPAPAQHNDTPIAIHWDAHTRTYEEEWSRNSWHRYLPRKDLVLTMPTGRQVMLRLGFYLMWYTEYCLMVEINPGTPVSCSPSPSSFHSVPDYELNEEGMEYIRQAVEMSPGPSGWTAVETDDEPQTRSVGDQEGKDPDSGSHSDGMAEVNPIPPSPSRDDGPPVPQQELGQDSMRRSGSERSAGEAHDTPLRQSFAECTEARQSAESHHSTRPAMENPTTLESSPARRGRWKLWKKKLRSRFASVFRVGG